MLKKTITYVDYNDEERTEDFYFNLSKAELVDWEMSKHGGLSGSLKRIVASKDAPALNKAFKEVILKAYGEKSEDGKRFIKSEELSTAFYQTEAYSVLYMELIANDGAGFVEFVEQIMPKDLREQSKTQSANK